MDAGQPIEPDGSGRPDVSTAFRFAVLGMPRASAAREPPHGSNRRSAKARCGHWLCTSPPLSSSSGSASPVRRWTRPPHVRSRLAGDSASRGAAAASVPRLRQSGSCDVIWTDRASISAQDVCRRWWVSHALAGGNLPPSSSRTSARSPASFPTSACATADGPPVFSTRINGPLGSVFHREALAGRPLSVAGKGMSPSQSRAGCLAEAVERYSACCQGDEPRLTATAAELGSAAVPPESRAVVQRGAVSRPRRMEPAARSGTRGARSQRAGHIARLDRIVVDHRQRDPLPARILLLHRLPRRP